MRRILPTIAVFLVYLLTPMASEVTESLVHWVTDGHSAHAYEDAAHHSDEPEHGCSGSFHVCPCHSSVTFAVLTENTAQSVDLVPLDMVVHALSDDSPADGYRTTFFRPPIA